MIFKISGGIQHEGYLICEWGKHFSQRAIKEKNSWRSGEVAKDPNEDPEPSFGKQQFKLTSKVNSPNFSLV